MIRKVAALRGLRFEASKAGPLEGLVAPPYDVVTRVHIRDYVAGNPYNVIQLDVGLDAAGGESLGQWEAVARRFRQWISDGILRVDPEPFVYVMEHRYHLRHAPGERVLRVALAGLRAGQGPQRAALAHERTMAAVRQDRARQISICRAQFSPILALVSDPSLSVQKALDALCAGREPEIRLAAPSGGDLALWVAAAAAPEGRSVMDALAASLDASPAIIADGHHRYEAACEAAAQAGSPLYLLAGLASIEGQGLTVLPIHRVLGPGGSKAADVLRMALYEHFLTLADHEVPPEVEALRERSAHDPHVAVSTVAQLRRKLGRTVIGVWWGAGEFEWLAVPSKAVWRSGSAPSDHGGVAGDIALLHQGPLMPRRLAVSDDGVPNEKDGRGWVRFTADVCEAVGLVDRGEAAAAVLLAPVDLAEIRATALAGKRMPEKSTYFYPKLTSGLVLQDLDQPVAEWPPA